MLYSEFLLSAISVISLAQQSEAITFLLDSTQYPDIADHHCLSAYCAGLGFAWRNWGFHRSVSTRYMSERRQAGGCGGVTDCGAPNLSCDTIPYASTFDGGLGCFADEWVNSGRPLEYLYSTATHRCVPTWQISAHDAATQTFYTSKNIKNFQLYSVDVATVGTTGYADPRSKYCNALIQAAILGKIFDPICEAAAKEGRFFEKVTSTAFQNGACPTRHKHGHKRAALAGHRHNFASGVGNAPPSPDPNIEGPPQSINPVGKSPNITFATLENGIQTFNVFGSHQVGGEMWVHGPLAALFHGPGSTSKITQIHRRPASLNQSFEQTMKDWLRKIFKWT